MGAKFCNTDRHFDFLVPSGKSALATDLKTCSLMLSELSAIYVEHKTDKKCVEGLLTFPTLSCKHS